MSGNQFLITLVVDHDTVAALVLGGIAGAVGRTEEHCHTIGFGCDLDQADTRTNLEGLVVPQESEFIDGDDDLLRNGDRLIQRAVHQQQAEFVAAQTGQRIAFTNGGTHLPRQLSQELVTGLMTTGVVDDLELVKVDVE